MIQKTVTFLEQKAEKITWGIIFLTFFAGWIYSMYLGDVFRFYDEGEYFLIAQNIVQKGFYTINGTDPSAWRPPGFPMWLSLFLSLGFNIFLLRMVNFLLLCVSLYLVYKILEPKSKLFSLLGVALMSFYPLFFFTASTLYPQTFVMALFLLTLYLLFRDAKHSYVTAVFVGAIYGVLTLSVVTFVGSLFITALWIVYSCHEWKKAALMVATAVMVLMPWTIRNYLVFDTFVFVANNGGIAFVLGNSPDTQPNLGGNIDLPQLDQSQAKSEVAIDRHYKSTAVNFILNNKIHTVKMYFLKLLNHFNFTNVLMTKSQMSLARDVVLFITYYTLLGLAVARMAMFKKIPLTSKELYLAFLYLAHGMLLALFITRIRYRLPYDPLLAILAAPALGYFLLKISGKAENKENQ